MELPRRFPDGAPRPLRWAEEGPYWRGPEFPNAWGQTGFYIVEIERGDGIEGLGVHVESSMCETFLLPQTALAFAARVRRVATQAIQADGRAHD